MKIISKYKDFYDFLVQDYNSDLLYIREPQIFYTNYDNLYKEHVNLYKRLRYSKFFYDNKFTKGDIVFKSYLFGVYPYVYSQPCVSVYYTDHNGIIDYETIVLTKSIIDNIYNGNIDALYDYCWKNMSKHTRCCLEGVKLKINGKNILDWLNIYTWKVECKEIFKKLNAPIFVKYEIELFYQGCYWTNFDDIEKADKIGKSRSLKYITNISFSKLMINILKYWFDELNNLNTYTNIENFLWSIKQEPINEPDNKTKIVSHGFDLKTSFRKM